jgi:hypothetical protein
MGMLPGWDSLGHKRLVVALEEDFRNSFSTYVLPELLDVERIGRQIRNLQP